VTIAEDTLVSVYRAADDLRRGQSVVLRGDTLLMVTPLETLDDVRLKDFAAGVSAEPFIMITANRAKVLHIAPEDWAVVRLDRPSWMSSADLGNLADPTLDLANPMRGPFKRHNIADTDTDRAAVKLAKIARLLPAVLAVEISQSEASSLIRGGLLASGAEAVLTSDSTHARSLKIVARAQVPLEASAETQLISFRSPVGGPEHIAIVVGGVLHKEDVLTRIHSECFTGDLLGSLKCDCGQQLRGAIAEIAKAGGGVVLYLAQEGRGIGLNSKLKAYALQSDGFDTVDANLRLGFDIDERIFEPAASMLKALGVKSVRLMTNNPEKVAAMARYDIIVSERVEHSFPPNPHNEQYLAVKKSKTGHFL
jgi:GTP cyclohydrolase II